MRLHVVQTPVQIRKHFRKLLPADQVTRAGSIQPSGDGLQKSVELVVPRYILRQSRNAGLLGRKTLAA